MARDKIVLESGSLDKMVYTRMDVDNKYTLGLISDLYKLLPDLSEFITLICHIKPHTGCKIDEVIDEFINKHQNYGLICTTIYSIEGTTPPLHKDQFYKEISDSLSNIGFVNILFNDNFISKNKDTGIFMFYNQNARDFIVKHNGIIDKYYW